LDEGSQPVCLNKTPQEDTETNPWFERDTNSRSERSTVPFPATRMAIYPRAVRFHMKSVPHSAVDD